jgi:large-conductance mechanosensitive channel
MLIRRKTIAYQFAPVLLILLTGVAIVVISQTIVQTALGIVLNLGQLLGLVILFVILGAIALFLNIKLLKHTK